MKEKMIDKSTKKEANQIFSFFSFLTYFDIMRLDTYFRQQAQKSLSESDKIRLYERILTARSARPHSLRARSALIKKSVYSFLALGLVFAFFGTFFWDNWQKQDYRAFWTQKIPSLNTANADQIWKILEINWDYIIEKEGKQFKNSVLFDEDLIILKPEAKILFNISTDTKIEVEWPAQLRITKRNDGGFHLNLLQGDYLTIESKSAADIIELETAQLNIETQKDQEIRLELSKSKKQLQLKNNGAPLLVRNKLKDKQPSTQLAQAKILTIQENDLSKIEDIQWFKNLLANNRNITHTAELKVEPTWADADDLQTLGALLTRQAPNTNLATEEVSSINEQLEYHGDQKLIPSEEQISHISAALNKQFLLSDLKQLFLANQTENNELKNQTYFVLNEKIKSIGNKFSVNLSEGNTTEGIKKNIDQLIKGLSNYHLPPNKLSQLTILKSWITYLEKTENLTGDWESLMQKTPQYLQFN